MVNISLLILSIFFLLLVVSTAIISLITRGRLYEFLKDSKKMTKEGIRKQVLTQKEVFSFRLLLLKAFGVISLFLLLIHIGRGVIQLLEAWFIAGEIEPTLYMAGLGEFILGCRIALGLSLLAFIFYFLFSWVFQKRLLFLQKMEDGMRQSEE